MFVRKSIQKTKSGKKRIYGQLSRSYRRPSDGMPANKVIAHLGRMTEIEIDNMNAALALARKGKRVTTSNLMEARADSIRVKVVENLVYLPLGVIGTYFRRFGLRDIINSLATEPGKGGCRAGEVTEALVMQRCVEPGSKLALQRWMRDTAIKETVGVSIGKLNNTRVHWAMTQLHEIRDELQQAVHRRVISRSRPRILYFDITDTWFEAGGGTLASYGQTKQGHKRKLKIQIALMVNEDGLPMRWEVLPGRMSESRMLPGCLSHLNHWPELKQSVLVFDRGFPTPDNMKRLLDFEEGHLFLCAIKWDSIQSYVSLNEADLDALQSIDGGAGLDKVTAACARLGMTKCDEDLFAGDLGLVDVQKKTRDGRKLQFTLKGYLYFNREIQKMIRYSRAKKMKQIEQFVADLNQELKQAKNSRKEEPTRRKVTTLLSKFKMMNLYDIHLHPSRRKGKKGVIRTFRVELTLRQDALELKNRFDGIYVFLGHPDLEWDQITALEAYRNKSVIEADYRTIKSVLDIQPVFHDTDVKIKSHVTLCTLALLVERLIEADLRADPQANMPDWPKTTNSLLKGLRQGMINRVKINSRTFSTLTDVKPKVTTLLRALDCEHLLDRLPTEAKVKKDAL